MEEKQNRLLFDEITGHLMEDEKPSDYMNALSMKEVFNQYPLGMLNLLKSTEQSKKYHPEGSVWNHTMLVVDEAAKVREQAKDVEAFMWAALLHDIGKPGTTRMRKDKITSYDHDKAGEKLCIEFLRAFTEDEFFIRKVAFLVRYHMHMLYVTRNLPYGDIAGLVKSVDIDEIALLCLCDRLGRTGADKPAEEAEYNEFKVRLNRSALIRSK